MVSDVVTVDPDRTVAQTTEVMKREGVGCIVVCEQEKPVGILTDRDVALFSGTGEVDPAETPVSDIMTKEVFSLTMGKKINDATIMLRDHGFRRAPVVDEQGDLKGILTLDDIILHLADELHDIADVIRVETPGFK